MFSSVFLTRPLHTEDMEKDTDLISTAGDEYQQTYMYHGS